MTLSEKITKQANVCKKLEDQATNLRVNIELVADVVEQGGSISVSANFFDFELEVPAQIIHAQLEKQLKAVETKLTLLGESYKAFECGQNDVQK